jgi:hypothetical protein
MSSSKLTCKGTLRQLLIRVYRTGDTVSHVGIFDPVLWTVAPLTFSLVQLSPPPLPLHVKSTLYAGKSSNTIFRYSLLFSGTLLACLDPDPLTHLNPDAVQIRIGNTTYPQPPSQPTWEEMTTCQLCEPMTKQTKNVRRKVPMNFHCRKQYFTGCFEQYFSTSDPGGFALWFLFPWLKFPLEPDKKGEL